MAQCYLRDDAPPRLSRRSRSCSPRRRRAIRTARPAQFLLGEAQSILGAYKEAEVVVPGAPEHDARASVSDLAAHRRADDRRRAIRRAQPRRTARRSTKSPDWTNTNAIRRSLADLALAAGNPKEAVAQYDALRGRHDEGRVCRRDAAPGRQRARAGGERHPGDRGRHADLPGRGAQTMAGRGRRGLQRRKFAHASIVALLDAGAPVDEFQRGVANYSNDVYELAIAAFDRLRAAEPDGRQGLAWYYAGLSYPGLGQLDKGIAASWTRSRAAGRTARSGLTRRWRRARALARGRAHRRGGGILSRGGTSAAGCATGPEGVVAGRLSAVSQRGRTRRPDAYLESGAQISSGRRGLARVSRGGHGLLPAGRMASGGRDLG